MKLYEKLTYVIIFTVLLSLIFAVLSYNVSAVLANITALLGWGHVAVHERNERIRNEIISG